MRAKMIIRKYLRLVDGDRMMTHPQFRQKLEAVGFGVFIPIFFVASGIRFDLAALFASPSTILRVPAIPRGVTTRQRRTCSSLPSTRWLSSFGCRGAFTGNIAFVHHGCIADQLGTRPDYKGDRRSSHSRCIAVSPHLPDYRARDLASQ